VPELEVVIIVHGVGGAERAREVFLRIVVVLIRRINKVLRS
jgi:hypothetical protein